MVKQASQPVIVKRMFNRYKPSGMLAYIISVDDWDDYFRWLTPTVQEIYNRQGFYDINPENGIPMRGNGPGLGVIAMTYKGLPVVSYVDAAKVLLHFGRKKVVIL